MGRRGRVLLGPVLAALVLAASCGSDDGDGGSAEASGDVVEVATLDNVFDPEEVEVEVGATVEWINEGRNEHNVKPVDESADWGVDTEDFEPGDTYRFTFEDEGVFRYYCTIHGTPTSGQIGAVIVGDVDAAGVAAGDGDGDESDGETTIRVPEDHETIQAAVDAADPGSLILVGPGVYEEAVTVETDDVVIRGLDRNEVILDGGFELENGVRVVGADGVVVENMTARNYTHNGFFWTGVDGYRGSYLTAYRNGDYGVYAFDSYNGQFDNSYASGSPDAGFYIGQCYPCNAVITDVVSEYNGLGYSGTNSGGDLFIVNSTFRYNRAGIVPNSGDYEEDPPERESTIVGNVVHSNNNGESPAIDAAMTAQGNGILIAGGIDNVVERNLVYDHDLTGIAGVPLPDENLWPATGNRVVDNVVSDSRLADLTVFSRADEGNCFSGNTFETSLPADIEAVLPCDAPPGDFQQDGQLLQRLVEAQHPPSGDYKVQPVPPAQPNMPDAETAPPRPATDVPVSVDLAAIAVPTRPEGD